MKQNICSHVMGVSAQPSDNIKRPAPGVVKHPILQVLPDEYLSSWVARTQMYWGHGNEEETIAVLFGGRSDRLLGGLDAIDMLVARTGGSIGSGTELVQNHTLARFYGLFEGRNRQHRLLRQRSTATGQLKFPLALWYSSFMAGVKMKACNSCLHNDRVTYGTAYWRLGHQYPGTHVCLLHGEALCTKQRRPVPTKRFQFDVPRRSAMAETPAFVKPGNIEQLRNLALFIHNLAADLERTLEVLEQWRGKLFEFLQSQGLVNPTGHLQSLDVKAVKALCESYVRLIEPIGMCDDYAGIDRTGATAHRVISLFMKGKVGTNEMEYIMLLYWLRTLPFWTDLDEREWFT